MEDNQHATSGFMVCRNYPPHVEMAWVEEKEEMGHIIPAHYTVRFYTSEGRHCLEHWNMPPEYLESFRMTFNLACDQAWDDRREASMKTGLPGIDITNMSPAELDEALLRKPMKLEVIIEGEETN